MTQFPNNIRYLERSEIDHEKWDHCIQDAVNGLIYARTFYLDAMASKWSALVLNDYEMVMPLTWNRKFGISYLYQPAFTAQLGIFSKAPVDEKILESFIYQTKQIFKFCEIHLNYGNISGKRKLHANYVLELGSPYPELRNGYRKRLLTNLSEAEGHSLQYLSTHEHEPTIRLFKHQYGDRFPHVKNSDYVHFKHLCGELRKREMIFLREVKDASGKLINSSIFLKDNHRIYNIMSVSPPEGRKKRAHFYLLDQLIREYAGTTHILDFEGSEVPGIAEFYQKFGSVNQPYPSLTYNRLPFLIRYFKKVYD